MVIFSSFSIRKRNRLSQQPQWVLGLSEKCRNALWLQGSCEPLLSSLVCEGSCAFVFWGNRDGNCMGFTHPGYSSSDLVILKLAQSVFMTNNKCQGGVKLYNQCCCTSPWGEKSVPARSTCWDHWSLPAWFYHDHALGKMDSHKNIRLCSRRFLDKC